MEIFKRIETGRIERPKIHTLLYVPENQLSQYAKAASETGVNFRVLKVPGDYVDEVTQYAQLDNEYLVGISVEHNSEFVSFRDRVDILLDTK